MACILLSRAALLLVAAGTMRRTLLCATAVLLQVTLLNLPLLFSYSQASLACPRLTPRAWLERRWNQQATAGNRCSNSIRTAASSTLDLPLQQHPAGGVRASQYWTDVVVLGNRRSLQQHALLLALQQIPVVHHRPQPPVQHKQPQQKTKQQQQDQQLGNPGHTQSAGKQSNLAAANSNNQVQLMHDIKAATSIRQLQQLYKSSRRDMDVIHASSMLNRLAHLYSALHTKCISRAHNTVQQQQAGLADALCSSEAHALGGQQPLGHEQQQNQCHLRMRGADLQQHHPKPQQEPAGCVSQQHCSRGAQHQAHKLLRGLLADFLQHLSSAGTRQISSTLWVIARFREQAAASSDIQHVAAALLQKLLVPAAAINADGSSSRHGVLAVDNSAGCGTSSSTAAIRINSLVRGHAAGGQQQQVRRSIRHHMQSTVSRHQQPAAVLLSSGSSTDVANTVWSLGRLAGVSDLQGGQEPLLQSGHEQHAGSKLD